MWPRFYPRPGVIVPRGPCFQERTSSAQRGEAWWTATASPSPTPRATLCLHTLPAAPWPRDADSATPSPLENRDTYRRCLAQVKHGLTGTNPRGPGVGEGEDEQLCRLFVFSFSFAARSPGLALSSVFLGLTAPPWFWSSERRGVTGYLSYTAPARGPTVPHSWVCQTGEGQSPTIWPHRVASNGAGDPLTHGTCY